MILFSFKLYHDPASRVTGTGTPLRAGTRPGGPAGFNLVAAARARAASLRLRSGDSETQAVTSTHRPNSSSWAPAWCRQCQWAGDSDSEAGDSITRIEIEAHHDGWGRKANLKHQARRGAGQS